MKTLKLNGIFNMSFGKTFFTGETENIYNFINEKSTWDIFINNKYFQTIEFECENLPLIKGNKKNNYRSFSYNGVFDKNLLDYDNKEIVLKLKETNANET